MTRELSMYDMVEYVGDRSYRRVGMVMSIHPDNQYGVTFTTGLHGTLVCRRDELEERIALWSNESLATPIRNAAVPKLDALSLLNAWVDALPSKRSFLIARRGRDGHFEVSVVEGEELGDMRAMLGGGDTLDSALADCVDRMASQGMDPGVLKTGVGDETRK